MLKAILIFSVAIIVFDNASAHQPTNCLKQSQLLPVYTTDSGKNKNKVFVVTDGYGTKGEKGDQGVGCECRERFEKVEKALRSLKQRMCPHVQVEATFTPLANGYEYHHSKWWHNYTSAQAYCAERGAQLAYIGIRDPNHHISIGEYILNDGFNGNVWIGLDDIKVEGEYKWLDGEELNPEKARWAYTPKPNVESDDCAILYLLNRKWEWYDYECSYTGGKALCERKIDDLCSYN